MVLLMVHMLLQLLHGWRYVLLLLLLVLVLRLGDVRRRARGIVVLPGRRLVHLLAAEPFLLHLLRRDVGTRLLLLLGRRIGKVRGGGGSRDCSCLRRGRLRRVHVHLRRWGREELQAGRRLRARLQACVILHLASLAIHLVQPVNIRVAQLVKLRHGRWRGRLGLSSAAL
jgi:hypothetical protein